jgi:hypothetical protein
MPELNRNKSRCDTKKRTPWRSIPGMHGIMELPKIEGTFSCAPLLLLEESYLLLRLEECRFCWLRRGGSRYVAPPWRRTCRTKVMSSGVPCRTSCHCLELAPGPNALGGGGPTRWQRPEAAGAWGGDVRRRPQWQELEAVTSEVGGAATSGCPRWRRLWSDLCTRECVCVGGGGEGWARSCIKSPYFRWSESVNESYHSTYRR